MRSAKVLGVVLNGVRPHTEDVIPTELNDLIDGNSVIKNTDLGNNLQISPEGTVSVKEASEFVAGGLYYWEDSEGYWHLTTTDPEPEIEYVEDPTGTTVIVNTRGYTVEPNETGETVIL